MGLGGLNHMLKRMAAVLAVGFATLQMPGPAQAADALALKVLGFSPDGRYFGFVQYGALADAGQYLAETYVIDTSRDRYVSGAPVRTKTEPEDDKGMDKEVRAVLAKNAKSAAGLIGQYKLSASGKVLAQVKEAHAGQWESGEDLPKPSVGAKNVAAKHAQLGELNLKLEIKELPWPKTSKLGSHKEAGSCADEVDWQKGAGFRLTLERGGRTIVLNDDNTIPASRHCVSGYGIAEVHAFDRPDGKVTLAIILGMNNRGFEGEDRVFLAVTKVLDR